MRRLLCGVVVTPARVMDEGWVLIEDGTVAELGTGTPPSADVTHEFPEGLILPGLIDPHVHGGGGLSMSGSDPRAVAGAARCHLSMGTTMLFGGVVTAPIEQMATAITAVAGADFPSIAGIYLEGPFLAPSRRGAHPAEHLRGPTSEEIESFLATANGALRMLTLAPELAGGFAAIALLQERGVIPAVGHSACTYEEAHEAIRLGAKVLTHAFNGLDPLSARAPGPLPAFLEQEVTTVEVINDGVHVHGALVGMLWQTIGPDRIMFISDATPAAGVGDGEYLENGNRISVVGAVARDSSGGLAGGADGLVRALQVGRESLGLPLTDLVRMTSTTAARTFGLHVGAGDIVPGTPAALLMVDRGLRPRLSVLGETTHSPDGDSTD